MGDTRDATQKAERPTEASGTNDPGVSAVIPAYNAADTIERAINSVYAQTYAGSIEIVLVDDGSEDQTAELVRDQYPDVRVVQQKNRGLPGARNSGVRAADCDLIAFLDADDEWLPNKLQMQVSALNALPANSVLFTWRQYSIAGHADFRSRLALVRTNAMARLRCSFSPQVTPISSERLVRGAPIAGASLVLTRDTYTLTDGYDESIKISEDYPFFLALMAKGCGFHVLNEPLYRVHIRPDSLHRAAEAGGSVARIEAFDRFDPRHSETGRKLFTQDEFDDAFQVRLLTEAIAHVDQGLVAEGRELIRRALERGDFDAVRTWALRTGLNAPHRFKGIVWLLRRTGLLRL